MQAFRTLVTVVALATGLPTVHAQTAHDWPNRPVRVIVPFAAGGSTDVATRLVGDFLSRSFGQQFFVENRAGANGVIGMDAAAKSDPDVRSAQEPVGGTAEAFAARVKEDFEKYGRLVQQLNIKVAR